ncbi:alpha/beta hydrolase YcfP [Vibrio palustris]|uniref:Uncharacterized protein n=1 Tax=Vibrio palustris TaxID=1918946 RepID=A0A1R4B1R9_9VIBR|nr:alpha/beta hydrolase YcfP [Vibrio palustris]SJL82868.1 hypothetical protein VPAL9027_00809 [Vibrio palustris]
MILYLHGFDSTSPGNHEKVLQLKFIDDDVRFLSYSTLHPKHDMQHLLNEVQKAIETSDDQQALICGVGLGAYWAERVGYLCGIKQVLFNPNLHPEYTLSNKIERPEAFEDIATKCLPDYRQRNQAQCLVILSRHDDVLDSVESAAELSPYYSIIWDENQGHKFAKISPHLQTMKAFKAA